MIEIHDNITKAEIAELPVDLFGGRIIVIHSKADVEKAAKKLLELGVIQGRDMTSEAAMKAE